MKMLCLQVLDHLSKYLLVFEGANSVKLAPIFLGLPPFFPFSLDEMVFCFDLMLPMIWAADCLRSISI